jgi:hypothetical protein
MLNHWFLTNDVALALCTPAPWRVGVSDLVASFAASTAFALITGTAAGDPLVDHSCGSKGFGIDVFPCHALLASKTSLPKSRSNRNRHWVIGLFSDGFCQFWGSP